MTCRRDAVLIAAAAALVAVPAHARPVPIGRTVQVAFGIPDGDPCGAWACDSRRTGRVAAVAPLDGTPTRVARAAIEGGILQPGNTPAMLAGGVVVMATQHGFVALRAGSAADPLWTARLDAGGDSVTRLPSGELLLATTSGELLVADAETGVAHTRARVAGGALAGRPLVLPDGTIVVSRGDGGLETRAEDTLAASAQLPLEVVTGAPVLLADGAVAVPASRSVVVIEPAGARVRGRFDVGALMVTRLAVGPDGTLWAVTPGGEAIGMDARTGDVRTRALGGDARIDGRGFAIAPDGGLRASVVPTAVAPGTPGAPSGPTSVVVATAPSGRVLWRRPLEGTMSGLVVDEAGTTIASTMSYGTRSAGGTVGLVPTRGALWAIDATGEVKWRVDLSDSPVGAPLVARDGSIVVVGTPAGQISVAVSTYRGP